MFPTERELAQQLVTIGTRYNYAQQPVEALEAGYQEAVALRRCYILHHDGQVVAYVIWQRCEGAEGAEAAFRGQETEGPDLYVRDLYVAEGWSPKIWYLRDRLPRYRTLYFHRWVNGMPVLHQHHNPRWEAGQETPADAIAA